MFNFPQDFNDREPRFAAGRPRTRNILPIPPPPSVGGVSYTALTDDTQEPIYYIGWTSDNTTYYISKVVVVDDGTTTTGEATGSWSDRYILIYT